MCLILKLSLGENIIQIIIHEHDNFDIPYFSEQLSMVFYFLTFHPYWEFSLYKKNDDYEYHINSATCGDFIPSNDIFMINNIKYIVKIIGHLDFIKLLNFFVDQKIFIKYNLAIAVLRRLKS